MILLTGIALSVTLFINAIVLIVLQYREKVSAKSFRQSLTFSSESFQTEDDRERKVQSQRFHYDAL